MHVLQEQGGDAPVPGWLWETQRQTQAEKAQGQGPYSRGQRRAQHGKIGGCLEGKAAVITSKIH